MKIVACRWERIVLGATRGGIALLAATLPAAAFSARVAGRGGSACGAVSPAFALKGVPRGTASLSLAVRDRDAPDAAPPALATTPYIGHGTIAKGAVPVTLPCPPKGSHHRYVWTIHALDPKGADLDMTEAVVGQRP